VDIQQVMEKTYKDMYPGPAPITEIMGRYEPESGSNRFRLFMTERRQEYIKRLKEEKPRGKGRERECPLCYSSHAIVYDDHLVINPDPFAMYDYHMLIRPMKEDVDPRSYELINGSYRLAYIAEDMLDCREYPTIRDIDAEVRLVEDTDYMVMQSMRGSGASVPEHIHAHAFKKNLMRFPLLEVGNFREIYCAGRIRIMRTEGPSYGLLIQGDSSKYGTVIGKLFNIWKFPFNLLLTQVSQYTVAMYFPRVKETPSGQLCQGLRETTIQDQKTRERVEESLIQILDNVLKPSPPLQVAKVFGDG
jgi:hypothetical protein